MKMVLDNSTPFPGTWELDDDTPLSGRELHWIKQIAGLRRNEFMDALKAGDYDLEIAFAVIALFRSGKIEKSQALEAAELLWDCSADALSVPDDESKPESLVEDPQTAPKENGAKSSRSKRTDSSPGTSESVSEESPETTPELTGVVG